MTVCSTALLPYLPLLLLSSLMERHETVVWEHAFVDS